MSRFLARATNDPVATGMAIRAARALPPAERPAAFHAQAELVVELYRNGIAHGFSLRDLGGFSTLAAAARGPQPAPEVNELGVPTSEAYWRWVVIRDASMDIANRAKALLTSPV